MCSGSWWRTCLRHDAERLCRGEHVCAAGDETHAVSSSERLEATYRTDPIRREWRDAARRGARSHGATMGGVAGHAGLFSTADDLATFAQEMLHGSRVLSRATDREDDHAAAAGECGEPAGVWGGILIRRSRAIAGSFLPVGSFGHTGFTGTRSGWIRLPTRTSFC